MKVRCCGANGSEDYIAALKPVPMECRDQVDGGEYPYGCAQQFAWWLGMISNTLHYRIVAQCALIVFGSKIQPIHAY